MLSPNVLTFETSDLNMASFLMCRSHHLIELRREKDGRSCFVFEDTAALHSELLEFANDGKVSVRTFCSTLRDLKAMTRTSQREGARP